LPTKTGRVANRDFLEISKLFCDNELHLARRMSFGNGFVKPTSGTVHHVTAADRGTTLAAFLRGRLQPASWSRIQKLVRGRQVLVHGNVCTDAARRLKDGEVVKVLAAAAPPPPKADDVRIVHLDDDVVVVDKPTGITTTRHHEEASWPARRRQIQPTLEELVPDAIGRFLAARAAGGRGTPRGAAPTRDAKRRRVPPVRAVHRIDRETSGLVVFARNVPASRILAEQFRLHTTHRRYLALVVGRAGAGTVRSHLVRDRGDGRRGSAEGDDGKLAVTHVTPVEHVGDAYTLVECRLETGRTHQIRIHMSESGHPVCGERVYVPSRRKAPRDESRAPRVMLHAAELGFVHPVTGKELVFESPLPEDIRHMLARLRKEQASAS
jgi:23S rRNA pseudouridine1911/1915/1917 synthase